MQGAAECRPDAEYGTSQFRLEVDETSSNGS